MVFGFCFSACKSDKTVFGLIKKKKQYHAHFSKPKNTFHSRAIINPSDTITILIGEKSPEKYSELSASKSFEISEGQVSSTRRESLWDKSIAVNYSQNSKLPDLENESNDDEKTKKTTKTLDILAAIFGLGAVISIFTYLPALFLGFGLGALTLALISKSLKPKKIKAEKPKNNREEVREEKPKPEPLTAEERKALEIEKLGFFSATSGLFALILTFMALGPYLFGTIALAIPILAAMSFLFGISSLKKFKDNPQKFRGKGFAYTGLGIGLLYLLMFLFLVVYYFSFFLY